MNSEYTVWAPRAHRVELVRNGQRITMSGRPGGWWAAEGVSPIAGDRYGYSLNGGAVRADPRSGYQPDGPEGLSEAVDHDAFGWTDGEWRGLNLAGAVLYELHVGTFSPEGTCAGVSTKLDHLRRLGVTAVEMMPITTFPGSRGWGYDGVGLFAPHRSYGGPNGMKRMVDAAHGAGIGVILDVVYNHLGPAGNYLAEFGPYFSARHRTNWGDAVNLDGPGSDEVRRFLVDNALMWLREYHLDGLRLDAVHALVDDSAFTFLEQLADEVHAAASHEGRPLWLIAESDRNDPRLVRSAREGGYGLDSVWADDWHHAWHAAFTGEANGYYQDFGSLEQLTKALRQAWVYDGEWSEHRQRTHGRPPDGLTGDRFVVSTQNHDQVGNRATGERSSALMSLGRLKVAAGLLLTSPFVPLLFQGEEWGAATPWQYFTDFDDAELAQAVTEGRRSEFSTFGWSVEQVPDPQDPATFERSRLDWSELTKDPHREILDWYRQLIGLRHRLPDLTDRRLERISVHPEPAVGGVVVERPATLVVGLIGPDPATVVVDAGSILAASDPGVRLDGRRLRLPPDSLAVFGRKATAAHHSKSATYQWARVPG
ncbi:MAG: malto-oligosyltrehalose trehalohydrolase [Acidimicrobiales bacterium]|nr:malto-oligosyltrehalose trehalohydrolase [Acidimicrobiales bacterium]